LKLLGVQNGGKQPPETGTGATNNREESGNPTPRENPPQDFSHTSADTEPARAEQHYNAAAAMLERHDKIVNKVKARH